MPFVSESQRRYFHVMQAQGKISPETVKEWEGATSKKKKKALPYYVKKGSELEKLAAKWDRVLAKMPSAQAAPHYEKMFRQVQGVGPDRPLVSHPEALTRDDRAGMVERLRALQKTPYPDFAPYGSPTYRAAWNDIRSGNMRSLETGTTLTAANSIKEHGPGAHLMTPAHHPDGGDDDMAQRMWEARRSVPSGEASKMLEVRARSGIYAADKGTHRTKDYANGSNGSRPGPDNPPARLSFDLPWSLTEGSYRAKEQRVGRDVFNRFARNKKVETAWDSTADRPAADAAEAARTAVKAGSELELFFKTAATVRGKLVAKANASARQYSLRETAEGKMTCACGDYKFRQGAVGGECKHLKAHKGAPMIRDSVKEGAEAALAKYALRGPTALRPRLLREGCPSL